MKLCFMPRSHLMTAPDTENRGNQHDDRSVFMALEIVHIYYSLPSSLMTGVIL